MKQLILYVLGIQKHAMKLLALHTTNFTELFLWKISLEKFSGPDGGVQVEKKQGGGWKKREASFNFTLLIIKQLFWVRWNLVEGLVTPVHSYISRWIKNQKSVQCSWNSWYYMSRNLEKWRKRNHICIIHLSFQISTMSLDNFSGPNGRVQVEKQGGGWKEGKKEERLQSMSVQRQSVYVIRVQTESGCQKWSRAHRLTAPPRPVRRSTAAAATTGTVTIGAATLAVNFAAAAATAARRLWCHGGDSSSPNSAYTMCYNIAKGAEYMLW